jgi:hypothetical protein
MCYGLVAPLIPVDKSTTLQETRSSSYGGFVHGIQRPGYSHLLPDTFLSLGRVLNTAAAKMALNHGIRGRQPIGTITGGHDVVIYIQTE